jgi:CBS domain containing-hemolysin-like protein
MGANVIILSALCLVFLAVSALISASETALFSIPRERIDSFREHASRPRRLIYSLLADGQRTLHLILLCNTFVNITLTGLIDSLMAAVTGKSAALLSFAAATVSIILFGEILPKNGALRKNEAIATMVSPVLYNAKILASPLLSLMQTQSRFFLRRFKRYLKSPSPFITIDELKSAVRSSYERGVISKSEQGIVTGLLERGAQPAKRFMTHRSQITFLPHYTTAADALSELVRRGRTCALITRGARGHQVTGVVRLPELLSAPPKERCRQLAAPPQWIPETLEAGDLISFMFAEKLGEVCVLDEFGGLSGVFSLSEGLGRVMNFKRERPGGGGGAEVFSGLSEIDGMAGWLPESLLSEHPDVRTLNGLLTRHLGRIPKTGERFDIGGRNFYIMYSGPSRIESVLIEKQTF